MRFSFALTMSVNVYNVFPFLNSFPFGLPVAIKEHRNSGRSSFAFDPHTTKVLLSIHFRFRRNNRLQQDLSNSFKLNCIGVIFVFLNQIQVWLNKLSFF